MTPPESAAFWVWYSTGLKGRRKRSFKRAAAILGHNVETITRWAEDYGWKKMAEAKDHEIQDKIEDIVISAVLEDAGEIIKRQRHLIAKLYERAEKAVSKMRPSIGQILELMEYERTLDGNGALPQAAGVNLNILLQHLSPEARGEVHRAGGELFRSGRFNLGDPVGSPGRN